MIKIILPALLLLFSASFASGQNYPAKPVRVIVPFVAGGAADIVTRVVSQNSGKSGASR